MAVRAWTCACACFHSCLWRCDHMLCPRTRGFKGRGRTNLNFLKRKAAKYWFTLIFKAAIWRKMQVCLFEFGLCNAPAGVYFCLKCLIPAYMLIFGACLYSVPRVTASAEPPPCRFIPWSIISSVLLFHHTSVLQITSARHNPVPPTPDLCPSFAFCLSSGKMRTS